MLPSKGYFSKIPCVFFSDGGCNRPHCHYRHSYQDVISISDVGPKTQNARPLKPTSSKHFRSESSDQGLDLSSWSPEQVSLVTKLVENAVDKALRSDLAKMPRSALVKNTLDKLFADPEALKMASKRNSSCHVECVPAYKPTPISKLNTKHIPVLCVPEKPYSSLTKTTAHINPSNNISPNLMQNIMPSKTKPILNSGEKNFDLPVPNSNNVQTHFQTSMNSASGRLDDPLKSYSEEPNHNNQKELNHTQGFYRDNTETRLAEYPQHSDSQHSYQLKNIMMQCIIPLKRLAKSEVDKYDFDKSGEGNSISKVTREGKTKTTKKSKVNISNITSSRDSNPNAETDLVTMRETSVFQVPVVLDMRNKPDPVAGADVVATDLEVMGPKPLGKSREQFDCCELPAKKRKSESASDHVTLQVSSTADPFSRWMQNKRIRQILGKDKKLKNSSKTPTVSEPEAQKRPPHRETPSNTNIPALEDELPEPKVSKRIAHKLYQFRPMAIIAEDVKIPSALRHHFCAAFFEEFKKTMCFDEAKKKASDEELQVAKNSKTTKTYKNNCSLLIMKYRKGKIEVVKLKPVDLTPASCPDFTYGWSLYQSFSSYLLTESELKDNGFPLAVPNTPNCAYVDKATRRYSTQQPDKPFHKICANCSVEFQIDGEGFPTTMDDCLYHWGKLRRVQYKGQIVDKFTCCGGSVDSAPCEVSVYHVWSGGNEDCMDDFVETTKLPSYMEDHEAGIYALDCEMCYTTKGLELARLTVLDLNGRVVFDEVVSMKNPILNYCTRFSGIDARKTASARYTFDDVRGWILDHFYDKTILIGHSLENDLKALKLIHRTIVDTSVTFPHKFGPPNKMSLKHLANVVLELNIQENTDGHDSKEDAATCLKLMMKKIHEDSKARKPRIIIGYNGKKK